MFGFRPAKGWAGYRTPIAGLYLWGSGAHPAGGVLGAPGRNAALVALEDMGRRNTLKRTRVKESLDDRDPQARGHSPRERPHRERHVPRAVGVLLWRVLRSPE